MAFMYKRQQSYHAIVSINTILESIIKLIQLNNFPIFIHSIFIFTIFQLVVH